MYSPECGKEAPCGWIQTGCGYSNKDLVQQHGDVSDEVKREEGEGQGEKNGERYNINKKPEEINDPFESQRQTSEAYLKLAKNKYKSVFALAGTFNPLGRA